MIRKMTNPRKILGIRLSVVVAGVLGFVLGAAAVPSILTGSAYAGKVPAAISSPLADTTFPPPIYNDLASQPSFVVNINDNGNSVSFSPQVISVPVGMTVIWFNNGADEHTVTTMATNGNNDASTAPQTINSDLISADGGSFIYTFTQPGVYRYVDRMDPRASGIVNVGGAVEYGNNFEMHIGGLNPAQSDSLNPGHGVTLRFIPKTVSLPPDTAITYQVDISNAKGKVFSQQFDDRDGILDLELVADGHVSSGIAALEQQHQLLQQQVVSWGPDFLGEEGYGSTGTFHLQVPTLSGNSHYFITITVLDRDDVPASNVSDTFAVPLLNQ